MTQMHQIYKCELCGNITAMVHTGAGDLVCCGQPMRLCAENTVDASKEKHIPVIEKTAYGYTVTVGSVLHPMDEKHYIEWIELATGNASLRQFLKPGDAPKAEFKTSADAVTARAYCNLHGLWKA